MPGHVADDCLRAMPPIGLGNLPGPTSNQPMERVIRRTAAFYINQASAPAAATVLFYAHNPSPRLRWSITVGWELDPNVQFTPGASGPTWQMRCIRIPPAGGAAADLDDIFVNAAGVATPRPLPDGYEVDSAVKDVRGTLNLHTGTGTDLSSGLFGGLVIEARWEPHDAYTERDEIWTLLERADLYVIGAAPRLANGT
jgi:hypothetical protein